MNNSRESLINCLCVCVWGGGGGGGGLRGNLSSLKEEQGEDQRSRYPPLQGKDYFDFGPPQKKIWR